MGSVHLEGLREAGEASPCGREMTFCRARDAVRSGKRSLCPLYERHGPDDSAEGSRKNTEELSAGGGRGVEDRQGMKDAGRVSGTEARLRRREILEEKKYTKWLACDTIVPNLCLRTRRTGDYLVVNEVRRPEEAEGLSD